MAGVVGSSRIIKHLTPLLEKKPKAQLHGKEDYDQVANPIVREFLHSALNSSSALRNHVPIMCQEAEQLIQSLRSELQIAISSSYELQSRSAGVQDGVVGIKQAYHAEFGILNDKYNRLREGLVDKVSRANMFTTSMDEYRVALQSVFIIELRKLGWPIPFTSNSSSRPGSTPQTGSKRKIYDTSMELLALQRDYISIFGAQNVVGISSQVSTELAKHASIDDPSKLGKDAWVVHIALWQAVKRVRIQMESAKALDPRAFPKWALRVINSTVSELRLIARGELQSAFKKCGLDISLYELLVHRLLLEFVRSIHQLVSTYSAKSRQLQSPPTPPSANTPIAEAYPLGGLMIPTSEVLVYCAVQAAEELDLSKTLAVSKPDGSAVNALASDKLLLEYYAVTLCRLAEQDVQVKLESLFDPHMYTQDTLLLHDTQNGITDEIEAALKNELSMKESTLTADLARVPSLVWRIREKAVQWRVVQVLEFSILQAILEEVQSVLESTAHELAQEEEFDIAPFELNPLLYGTGEALDASNKKSGESSPADGSYAKSASAPLARNQGQPIQTSSLLRMIRVASVCHSMGKALKARSEEEDYIRLYAYVAAIQRHPSSAATTDASGNSMGTDNENIYGSIFDKFIREFERLAEQSLTAIREYFIKACKPKIVKFASQPRSGRLPMTFIDERRAELSVNDLVVLDSDLMPCAYFLSHALRLAKRHLADDVVKAKLWRKTATDLDERFMELVILPALSGSDDREQVPTSSVSAENLFFDHSYRAVIVVEMFKQLGELARTALHDFTASWERYFVLLSEAKEVANLFLNLDSQEDREILSVVLFLIRQPFSFYGENLGGVRCDHDQNPTPLNCTSCGWTYIRSKLGVHRIANEEIRCIAFSCLP